MRQPRPEQTSICYDKELERSLAINAKIGKNIFARLFPSAVHVFACTSILRVRLHMQLTACDCLFDIGFALFALTSASHYLDIGLAFILTSASHSLWHRLRRIVLTSASRSSWHRLRIIQKSWHMLRIIWNLPKNLSNINSKIIQNSIQRPLQ